MQIWGWETVTEIQLHNLKPSDQVPSQDNSDFINSKQLLSLIQCIVYPRKWKRSYKVKNTRAVASFLLPSFLFSFLFLTAAGFPCLKCFSVREPQLWLLAWWKARFTDTLGVLLVSGWGGRDRSWHRLWSAVHRTGPPLSCREQPWVWGPHQGAATVMGGAGQGPMPWPPEGDEKRSWEDYSLQRRRGKAASQVLTTQGSPVGFQWGPWNCCPQHSNKWARLWGW